MNALPEIREAILAATGSAPKGTPRSRMVVKRRDRVAPWADQEISTSTRYSRGPTPSAWRGLGVEVAE